MVYAAASEACIKGVGKICDNTSLFTHPHLSRLAGHPNSSDTVRVLRAPDENIDERRFSNIWETDHAELHPVLIPGVGLNTVLLGEAVHVRKDLLAVEKSLHADGIGRGAGRGWEGEFAGAVEERSGGRARGWVAAVSVRRRARRQ